MIDAREGNLNTKFMQRRYETSIASLLFMIKHAITKLLRAPLKIVLVKDGEREAASLRIFKDGNYEVR